MARIPTVRDHPQFLDGSDIQHPILPPSDVEMPMMRVRVQSQLDESQPSAGLSIETVDRIERISRLRGDKERARKIEELDSRSVSAASSPKEVRFQKR